MTKQKNPALRILKIVLCIIIVLVLVVGIAAYAMFHNELATIKSIEKKTDTYMTMNYTADYGLDEFLQTGAATDSELAAFIIKKMMKGLPVNISLPDLGCSAFNAVTPDGDKIFGRNFDNQSGQYALVHTKPATGYESISVANLSFVGYSDASLMGKLIALAAPYIPLDGINEKGLSVGVLQLYTDVTNQDTGKTDITTTAAIRMILDTCATVDEAITAMSAYDMHSSANAPYHFQIADANGDSATVEYLDNEMFVYRDPSAFTCTTNFVLTEGKYFNDGKGQDRYETMRTLLDEKNGVLTEEEGMSLLESVSQDLMLEGDIHISTLWSSLYNNTDCTLTLCPNMDYAARYTYSVDGKPIA